jgi:Fe-Mn family superoxide dismutase
MFQLPKLSYKFNVLEPYIDAQTMEVHYTKHHQIYVDKLNEALEKHPELADKSIEDLLKNLVSIPEDIRIAVRNHGGGHFNHSFFWAVMAPFGFAQGKPNEPAGGLKTAIEKDFGSFIAFKEQFSKVAVSHFGSGWAWLAKDKDGKLVIFSLPNQDCPLSQGLKPVLGLDLWEHAYYLKYQNRRAEYIENFFNVIDWREIGRKFIN